MVPRGTKYSTLLQFGIIVLDLAVLQAQNSRLVKAKRDGSLYNRTEVERLQHPASRVTEGRSIAAFTKLIIRHENRSYGKASSFSQRPFAPPLLPPTSDMLSTPTL
jgi:hypothetical protein